MSRRPTIALCMMAPGETEGIHVNRAACAPYVDEVCVLDTAGMQPFFFDEARNASLALAASDYVFVLDDDERLARPAVLDAMRDVLAGAGEAALVATVRNHKLDKPTEISRAERIFPARLRYEGAVHHRLSLDAFYAGGASKITPEAFVIEHYGYAGTAEERRRKYEQRLPLYRTELARHAPGTPHYGYYLYKLGECCHIAGLKKEAVDHLVAALPYLRGNGLRRGLILIAKCLKDVRRWPFTGRERKYLLDMAAVLRRFGDPVALAHATSLYAVLGKKPVAKRLRRALDAPERVAAMPAAPELSGASVPLRT